MRFEDRSQTVIFCLRNRIVHVVVAASTSDRQSEKRLHRVIDSFSYPGLATEHFIIAGEKAGRAQQIRIGGRKFIAGKHCSHHAVVGHVGIQRFHDPVTPTPDVLLAVANLLAVSPSGPVAVPPDIHPVPAPSLAELWTVQQPIDDVLVGSRRRVVHEVMQFLRSRGQSGQIESYATQ